MKIAIPYENGQVAQELAACQEYMVLTVEGSEPTAKDLVPCEGSGATAMLSFIGLHQIDVLICGKLGIAARNALEMLGVLLVPGVTGSCWSASSRATRRCLRCAARRTPTTPCSVCTTARNARAAGRSKSPTRSSPAYRRSDPRPRFANPTAKSCPASGQLF